MTITQLFSNPPQTKKRGEPVWALASRFPAQGYWTEEDYLALDNERNQIVELMDGYVEVLPMPTPEHQRIVFFLATALNQFAKPQKLGEALVAPLPVKLRRDMFREPDVVFFLQQHRPDGTYAERVDLAVEVVSAGKADRERDYKQKRREYSRARIPEYWIVDSQLGQITVFTLSGTRYLEHGVYKKGAKATSVLLKGFSVDVTKTLTPD